MQRRPPKWVPRNQATCLITTVILPVVPHPVLRRGSYLFATSLFDIWAFSFSKSNQKRIPREGVLIHRPKKEDDVPTSGTLDMPHPILANTSPWSGALLVSLMPGLNSHWDSMRRDENESVKSAFVSSYPLLTCSHLVAFGKMSVNHTQVKGHECLALLLEFLCRANLMPVVHSHRVSSARFSSESKAGHRWFARRPQDAKNMRKARNSREKKDAHEIM